MALWQTGRFLTSEIATIVKLPEATVANLLAIYRDVEAAEVSAPPLSFSPSGFDGSALAGAGLSAPSLGGKPLTGARFTVLDGGKS